MLRAAFDQIGVTGRKDGAQLLAEDQRDAPRVVRDQLKAAGWLRVQQRRMLGIVPTARLGLYDEEMVSGLADPVAEALRRAIDGLPAAPLPLAAGLLGVLGQMPTA